MATRLQDVADYAGVSVKTVSNVVNDFPHVRPELRARVQAAIDELGYRPNLTARRLRQGRTGLIALAVPELSVPYFAELAGHVLEAAEQHGLTLLIEQTGGRREREVLFARSPQSQTIDGLILSPLSADVEELDRGSASVPLVLLGERTAPTSVDHIAIDNVAAARTAVTHLAEGGRRRVAVLGAHKDASSRMADLRLAGYREGVSAAGISRDRRLVVTTSWFTRRDGYEATRRLMRSAAKPDAIFCLTDPLALGCLRALDDMGVRCPDDVAVVGIDGIEEGEFSVPSLTTIAPDKKQIAQQAITLLDRRIGRRAGTAPEPADVVAGHRLVVRESTTTLSARA